MALAFEDLRVLEAAGAIADNVWKDVVGWDRFSRDTLGKQLIEAADSIGAHLAEAYGRLHSGEKLTVLYYARGSLFATKYWINRAVARDLMDDEKIQRYAAQLADLARQLNALLATTKEQRLTGPAADKRVREAEPAYAPPEPYPPALFDAGDLDWLAAASPADRP